MWHLLWHITIKFEYITYNAFCVWALKGFVGDFGLRLQNAIVDLNWTKFGKKVGLSQSSMLKNFVLEEIFLEL